MQYMKKWWLFLWEPQECNENAPKPDSVKPENTYL
jgi:hypothetical protein